MRGHQPRDLSRFSPALLSSSLTTIWSTPIHSPFLTLDLKSGDSSHHRARATRVFTVRYRPVLVLLGPRPEPPNLLLIFRQLCKSSSFFVKNFKLNSSANLGKNLQVFSRVLRGGGRGLPWDAGRAPADRAGDRSTGRAGPVPTGAPGGDTNQRFGQRPNTRAGRRRRGARTGGWYGGPPPLPSSPPPIPLLHSLMRRRPPLRPSVRCHTAGLAGTGVAPPTAGRGGRPKIGGSSPGHPMGLPAGGR